METFGIFAVGLPLIFIFIYLASIALVLWIGYRLARVAVKNGILDADIERERLKGNYTAGWYPLEGGKLGYWDGSKWTNPPAAV